jgi:hypothetical protein
MIRIRVDIIFSVGAIKFEELAHMENCVAILHGDESKVVTPYKFKQYPMANQWRNRITILAGGKLHTALR